MNAPDSPSGVRKWWPPHFGFGRKGRRDTAEIDIWRLQSLFNNFRRILFLNNAVLEDMDHLERVLGGEYIFDRAFLEASVRTISSRVHHVSYNLNALTGNGYISLYDRYQAIRTKLDDILAGNASTLAPAAVLPLEALGWELEPLVGTSLVCLAELRHQPAMPVAQGFVVTTAGTEALSGTGEAPAATEATRFPAAAVMASIEEMFTTMCGQDAGTAFTAVVIHLVNEEEQAGLRQEYALTPEPGGSRVVIAARRRPGRHPLPPLSDAAPALTAPIAAASPADGLVRLITALAARRPGQTSDPAGQSAIFVRRALPAALRGSVRSRAGGTEPFDTLAITAETAADDDLGDSYLLRRIYPFDLIRSTIAQRPAGFQFLRGKVATSADETDGALARGSALIQNEMLKRLAGTTVAVERLFGGPVAVQWECGSDGSCLLTDLAPLQIDLEEVDDDALHREQRQAVVLCRGGQMVQSGIAAGRVVHVTDDLLPADFPAGAVAVARYASPQLTPILQRAAAVVTEFGTTIGHLATVARELRVPALFGIPDALVTLAAGAEVTVDASEATVFQGLLRLSLLRGVKESDLSPAAPEYRILRRLLRFILPLHLIDPDSPTFAPQGCRTYHDIIHFCHEKAVDELAHFQERRPELGAIRTRRLRLEVPMDIRVLDIGGGLAATVAGDPGCDEVQSLPFRSFLDGLRHPKAWELELPSLGLRDILSGMTHEMSNLYGGTVNLAENLAIVSHDYMNVSLRLGYHFNVIDSHLGVDEARNHVYFRFVGGLADPERRGRRVEFISEVLAAMDFKVTVKSDLVIGRLKLIPADIVLATLFTLGAMTTVAKQRDTCLYSDADTRALLTAFAATFLGPAAPVRGPTAGRQGPSPEGAATGQGGISPFILDRDQ